MREGDVRRWCVLEAWGGELLQRLVRQASLSPALGSLQRLGVLPRLGSYGCASVLWLEQTCMSAAFFSLCIAASGWINGTTMMRSGLLSGTQTTSTCFHKQGHLCLVVFQGRACPSSLSCGFAPATASCWRLGDTKGTDVHGLLHQGPQMSAGSTALTPGFLS